MASAITHFVVGASLALPAIESRTIRKVLKPWAVPLTAGLLAVVPDLDTPQRLFDEMHQGFWGHRGFFHSPFFLLLLCASLAAIAARRHGWRVWACLTLLWAGCAITHPLLDLLSDGGDGVMALYPFSTKRYLFPWHPIHAAPLGFADFLNEGRSRYFIRRHHLYSSMARYFSQAAYVRKSEMPFDLAALAIGVAGWLARRCRML